MEGTNLNIIAFYLLAGLSVCVALGILWTKNIIHAIFMLVIVFFGVAGIFIISNAEFVGVTQIIIYIGGVLILMVFGIMLTHRVDGQPLFTGHRAVIPTIGLGLGLLFLILRLLPNGFPQYKYSVFSSTFSVTERIGINLMTSELIAFEMTAVVLLMALIGAAFLSGSSFNKKKKKP